jgi:hypothetical protein
LEENEELEEEEILVLLELFYVYGMVEVMDHVVLIEL